jgi:Ca2+-binding EF-hand superfamily protein
MKLAKIFMAAGLALTLSASAQKGGEKKGDKKRGDRRHGGMMRGGGMRGMDPAEINKKLQELRKKADADGDGELNGDERKAFFTGMREAWTKQREDHMKKYDKDGDGELSDEEKAAVETERTDEEFKRLDTNGDGNIDKKEFLAGKEAERTGREKMGNMFRNMRGGNRGRTTATDGKKAMIERFDENGDGKVDDNERLKAAQSTLERMERKGLSGEWKKFDKDGNGTLSQAEKDALVLEIAERLKKKTEGGAKKAPKKTKGAPAKK